MIIEKMEPEPERKRERDAESGKRFLGRTRKMYFNLLTIGTTHVTPRHTPTHTPVLTHSTNMYRYLEPRRTRE